jgi:hypothetical protein
VCAWPETPISLHYPWHQWNNDDLWSLLDTFCKLEHWHLIKSHCCHLPCCTAHCQLLVYLVWSLGITCNWPLSSESKSAFHLNSSHSQYTAVQWNLWNSKLEMFQVLCYVVLGQSFISYIFFFYWSANLQST